MKYYKIAAVSGLVLLTLSRLLLEQGNEFIAAQRPIDWAHFFMLVGAVLSLAFSYVFPKNIFNRIATPLTVIGVIAYIGMCAIDMVFWSFGEDFESRNTLLGHLLNTPVIWIPFFVIGPAIFFAALTTQVWFFIKKYPIPSILALIGSICLGLGQMAFHNNLMVTVGHGIFTIGMSWLAYLQPDH